MDKIILIKYGELTTKKDNRNLFVNILYNNVKDKLSKYDVKIKKDRVRMFIESANDDIDKIAEDLKEVFGIHRIVICEKVNTNIDEIKELVLKTFKEKDIKTFKIETKRSDKDFPYHSMEINNILGGLILKNIPNIKVDVHNPEYLLKIEIRKDYTYIYTKELSGIGGYPVGVQGKGLVMLSGGIDSPVSAYLAMKRGIKIECIYFESPPHTSLQAKNKVIKLVQTLTKYQKDIKLHIINFTAMQKNIYSKMDPTYMITIMRRMMYRISESIAKRNKDLIIINGESVGQVASQTLNSMKVINSVTNYPILRPVACLDKLEIIALAKKIGTYETSILPYEDCCTIFVPKHPVINPKLERAVFLEENTLYQDTLNECVESASYEVISYKASKNLF